MHTTSNKNNNNKALFLFLQNYGMGEGERERGEERENISTNIWVLLLRSYAAFWGLKKSNKIKDKTYSPSFLSAFKIQMSFGSLICFQTDSFILSLTAWAANILQVDRGQRAGACNKTWILCEIWTKATTNIHSSLHWEHTVCKADSPSTHMRSRLTAA